MKWVAQFKHPRNWIFEIEEEILFDSGQEKDTAWFSYEYSMWKDQKYLTTCRKS